MPDTRSDQTTIFVKRYAAGKAFAFAHGDPGYAEQARRALARALVMEVKIDRARFVEVMREQGVPDLAIGRWLASTSVTDEAWLQDGYPS